MRGRPRWGRVLLGIAVIVLLALPCLVAAIAVIAGGNLYARSNAVGAGRAPGTLTFDTDRERYVIALSSKLDGLFDGLREGLTRTERRQPLSGLRRRAVQGPLHDRAPGRLDLARARRPAGGERDRRHGYLTVGEFDGREGRTTVTCRFDPPKDLLGTVTETPLMVHEASSLRALGWGLFVGVFLLAGVGTLLILWGTVWRRPRRT